MLIGNLTLFQLFHAVGESNGVAWITVLVGAAAAFVAVREGSSAVVRATGVAIGALGGVLAVYFLVGLRHEIQSANGFAALGIGPYLAVAGCVAMGVGGFLVKPGG